MARCAAVCAPCCPFFFTASSLFFVWSMILFWIDIAQWSPENIGRSAADSMSLYSSSMSW